MARRVKDQTLDSRQARAKLKVRGKPYFRIVEEGAHIGYRRLKGRAGSWCCRFYTGDQKYTVESIGSADDLSDGDGVDILTYWQAVEKVRDRRKDRAQTAAGVPGPFTVRKAAALYLEHIEARGQPTYDSEKQIDAHILPTFGDVEVAALTTEELRNWHAALARAPRRARTGRGAEQNFRKTVVGDEGKRARRASANRILTILKACLNYNWREGRVPSDSAWRRVEPFKAVDATRGRYLSIAEAQRLVNATEPAFRPMVEAALATGCRYGELCRLQVHDFDRDAGTIHIRKSKTGKARFVHLAAEGVELFASLTVGKPGNARVLTRPDGSAWQASNQQRPMIDACERARLKPRITFHGLRHCWTSLAVKAGIPLLVCAKNLGHRDVSMIERHYGHLAPGYAAEAIRAGAPQFGFSRDRRVVPIDR